MRPEAITITVIFALAVSLNGRADPPEKTEKPIPLTGKELSGIWRGEKNGLTIEVIFRGPEFRGTKDDADWRIRDKSGSIFATLKRVDDKRSGSVHLRMDTVANLKGTVVGYLRRGENDTLEITVLPAASDFGAQYKPIAGFVIRKVNAMKLFVK